MKTKIVVFLVAIGVCIFFGNFALASSSVGTWKGRSVVYNTTCPNVYQNGVTHKLVLKIKEIDKNGRLKASVLFHGVAYKYKLNGRVKGSNIKFHYIMWGNVKTYDWSGTIVGNLMKLHSYNDRPGTCNGGYHLKFKLKKQ